MSARLIRTEPQERQAWLAVATQVNAGRYARATGSEVQSLLIGMRPWNDGEFWHAKKRLRPMRDTNE